jgi:hypothetical protein
MFKFSLVEFVDHRPTSVQTIHATIEQRQYVLPGSQQILTSTMKRKGDMT